MAEFKPTGNGDATSTTMLEHAQTNASVSIPIEVFERRYLTPTRPKRGVKVLGNPTPYALLGFLMAGSPLACTLLGWRGAGGAGAATIGFTYFFGGMLQIVGSVFELLLGNTFPACVFAAYGAFWLAFGATQQPSFNALAFFTSGAKTAAEEQAAMTQFYSSVAFALLFLAVLTAMFVVCALRTNAVLFSILVVLLAAIICLAASYWCLAEGNTTAGENLTKAGGALVLVLCLLAWYLEFHLLLDAVDFPVRLPVGDLSHRIKGISSDGKKNDDQGEAV